MHEIARLSSLALEAASFAVILSAVLISTGVFLVRMRRDGFIANFRDYRANLGRGILIGLELLIAADILKSVVIDPTLQGILVLGGIVLIRTFLSTSLDVEINGLPGGVDAPSMHDGSGLAIHTFQVGADGKASHAFGTEGSRNAVPWRLHLPASRRPSRSTG